MEQRGFEIRNTALAAWWHNPARAQEMAGRIIKGYAAVFNTPSEDLGGFTEQIEPGAFRNSLARPDDIKALINHNVDWLLARNVAGTLRLWEDNIGLGVELTAPNTSYGNDLLETLKRGDLTQMSFAFQVLRDRWEHFQDPATGARTNRRTLLEAKLGDVSFVTYPAYPATKAFVEGCEPAWMGARDAKAQMAARRRKLQLLEATL